jgi:hypothetical protein
MTDVQFDTDVSLNILRRRENYSYRRRTFVRNAGVSYFDSGVSRANQMISTTDRSGSLVANRVETTGEPVIFNSADSFIAETSNVLITDQFITIQGLSDPIPLFKRHIVNTTNLSRVSATDLTISSGIILTEVEILDDEMNIVDDDNILYDFDEGIIYNNLDPGYDFATDLYLVYYVRYSVSNGTTVSTYIELLDNQDIYTEATFDDLDEDLDLIDDGRKIYFVTYTDSGYEILLPSVDDYAYETKPSSKIALVKPGYLDIDVPWFIRVLNGDFTALVSDIRYRYRIAEFSDQYWDPEQPYKKVVEEQSIVLNDRLIKLGRENIHEDSSSSLYVDVLVDEADGTGVAAFTTNPSRHGTSAPSGVLYYRYSNANQMGIRSVNYVDGILDIVGVSLESDYQITSSYYFEEKEYEFTEVDFNPINNLDILIQRVFLFIDPEAPIEDKLQTVYYGIVDKKGQIIESNLSTFDNVAQTLTTGETLYYEAVPSFNPAASYVIFITDYSVEGSGIYLVLGDISVEVDSSIDDAVVVDIRISGGSIRDE